MKQSLRGWTLIEMVLTLVLIGIIGTLLATSLHQPLQWTINLMRQGQQIEPLTHFFLEFKQILQTPHVQITSLQGEHQDQITIRQPQGAQVTYLCDRQAHQLLKKVDDHTGVRLINLDCSFKLQEQEGWHIQAQMSLPDSIAIQRHFFVPKEVP